MNKSGREAAGQHVLHVLSGAERVTKPFDRKRTLVLNASMLLVTVGALFWAWRFQQDGRGDIALAQCLVASACGLIALLLHQGWLRLSCYLFALFILAWIVFLALVVDLPTEAVPRSHNYYAFPLFLGAHFLLQQEPAWARRLVLGLIGAVLVVLTGWSNPLGLPPVLSDAVRQQAAWFVGLFSIALTWVLLKVELLEVRERSELELALARALDEGQLQVYLQPQCSVEGRLVGAEALLRWQHPQRGFVSPAEFIPLAERSGLIRPIGRWVLQECCALAYRWAVDDALRGLSIAVNLSNAQLRSEADLDGLFALVQQAAPPRGSIKFELTESLAAQGLEPLRQLLQRCREHGILSSLDDFGTGFSSLSYLNALPFDQLKIDQSFVRAMGSDGARAGSLVETIVRLGRQLGMEVIAEGVETEGQHAELRRLGCHQVQGYWIAKPMPVSAFEDWARERAAA